MPKSKKKKLLELEIESAGFEGIAIARHEGKVYMVKGAVPGDKVIAEVKRKKSRYTIATVQEVLEKSPDRVEPVCPHFGVCGGCSWQNLNYEKQLAWKKQNVTDAFERLAGIKDSLIHDTMPSPEKFYYRNKMEFSFGASRWLEQSEIESGEEIADKNFAFGMHVPGRYDKIIDLKECHIHNKNGNNILNSIRDLAKSMDVSAYNQVEQTGFLKNLILRSSLKTGNLMLILITNKIEHEKEEKFLTEFMNYCSNFSPVETAIHAINDTLSPVATGNIEKVQGKGYLIENILGIDYKISPFSFFQTNSYQLDRFIGKILEYGELNPDDNVWDLYCGTGSITLPAAKQVKNISGFELVESSVNDAVINANLNNIENAEFRCTDLHDKEIPGILQAANKPDIAFIDPPRAGIHKNLMEHLLKLKIPRIVYVSCNPATQARDCGLLADLYSVEEIQPVDMFPHTYHIESIAKLKLR